MSHRQYVQAFWLDRETSFWQKDLTFSYSTLLLLIWKRSSYFTSTEIYGIYTVKSLHFITPFNSVIFDNTSKRFCTAPSPGIWTESQRTCILRSLTPPVSFSLEDGGLRFTVGWGALFLCLQLPDRKLREPGKLRSDSICAGTGLQGLGFIFACYCSKQGEIPSPFKDCHCRRHLRALHQPAP